MKKPITFKGEGTSLGTIILGVLIALVIFAIIG